MVLDIPPVVHSAPTPGRTATIMTDSAIRDLVEEWPDAAKAAAEEMLARYGMPQEATLSRLVWHRNGPWKRTTVLRDEADHNFPVPHKDVLEQVIDYRVPIELIDDLAQFDGSLAVSRTRGEVAATCGSEHANIAAVNLMDEIVQGRKTPAEAREAFTRAMAQDALERPGEGPVKFLFDMPAATADPDAQTITEKVVVDTKEELRRAEDAVREPTRS